MQTRAPAAPSCAAAEMKNKATCSEAIVCIVNPITRAMGPETVQGCDRGDQAGPLVGHNALIGPPTAPANRPRG
jgi:hypothetical protein